MKRFYVHWDYIQKNVSEIGLGPSHVIDAPDEACAIMVYSARAVRHFTENQIVHVRFIGAPTIEEIQRMAA